MFSLGFFEIVSLAVIALVVVGPEKLPGMARSIGRFLTELKRTTNTITAEINDQMDEEKFYADTKNLKKKTEDTQAPEELTDEKFGHDKIDEADHSEVHGGDHE